MRITALAVGLLGLALAAYAVVLYLGLPDPQPGAGPPAGSADRAAWPDPAMPHPDAWSAVQSGPPATAPVTASTGRFRLVGTYFMMPSAPDAEPVRKAVLDDTQQQTQVLVEEGGGVDDYTVQTIHRDRVVMRLPDGREQELWLRFGSGAPDPAAPDPATPDAPSPAWDEVTLERTRFGRRIADDRWILNRKELLAYREELLNDPERLAALFVSMKADRIDQQIEGYRLERQGEEGFWDAVGLRESDVIRRANSMKMTRQERAEYLIREFVSNRLNVVVLDIERDGNPQKLIYYLRE